MSEHDEPEGEPELVVPFVVTDDNGGPYDVDAFKAGHYHGEISVTLNYEPSMFETYVPTPLVPQLDLLAMHKGYKFKATEWDDDPEWSLVRFVRDAQREAIPK